MQGDAIRNITGAVRNANSFLGYRSYNVTAEGALSFEQNSLANVGNGNNSSLKVTGYTMNASRSVPTGNENRPANMAVRYLVRALN